MILIEHKRGLSYRKIAILSGNNLVTGQTIGRIAKSKGRWFPKSKTILSALGLLQKREKKISEMSSQELLWRLEHREKM